MEYDGLQRYMVEGMIADELYKEQSSAFKVLDEDGNVMPTANVSSYTQPNNIHKLIVESLLSECFPYGPTNISSSAVPQKVDPKIEKTRKMIQVVQDMLWRVSDTALAGDDDSINKTVQDACNPLIRTMIQKLYDLWILNNDTAAAAPKVEDKPEEKPEEKKEPSTQELANQLAKAFSQGESIMSPQNKEYIIEAVNSNTLFLKDKATGAKASVSIEIANEWKNRKGV